MNRHFKVELAVRELFLTPDVSYSFEVPSRGHAVVVTLRGRRRGGESGPIWDASCEATAQFEVAGHKLIPSINALERGEEPPGTEGGIVTDFDPWIAVADNPRVEASQISLGVRVWPEYVTQYLTGVHRSLTEAANRTIAIIRWRASVPLQHDPLKDTGGFFISTGDSQWIKIQVPGGGLRVRSLPHIALAGPVGESIRTMLADPRTNEPLAHSLMREAWATRSTTPRSALVIGAAAIESRLKQFATDSVPAATWIIENLPSPPIEKILEHFVAAGSWRPSGAEAPLFVLSKEIKATLMSMVTWRNELVHRGVQSFNDEQLEDRLLLAKDILSLLDYLGGHQWAYDHIRPATREAIRLVSK